ncbi:MAG: LytTR family DNA-binding domain-containing protein [Alphaproteobacteria bacterium]|nr:LytTR family DNA-binding domain-containing protein [Alphaproteobacteria bacterium]MBU1513730.1 LytTR family DNA-binding domain-containing protein [Alphaproteobacteria bacterium]MBU2094625.1 LytTR family DNA-binding domain-containing protein [Alphaproteobacteria bacterium]MBU2150306.1 LytTR family DNA-binding domain-containing protein [Alphaproteobacteria bacterium]MBU2309165.1 LytTR family DNA-binding domain-containing protein [Alphaproteobacteria bacterium]
MRVFIVDDEPLALEWLRSCLGRLNGIEIVGEAADGDAALERVAALDPDVVLLDIQMPGRSGVEVARALARRARPEVVFVTAFSHWAAEAFELDAADYLLKPVRADRLEEAMNRAQRRLVAPDTALATPSTFEAGFWVRQREGLVRVLVADIRRIEADKDYALIHTHLRTHILRTTMRELEDRLNPKDIVRVHRSAFVRLSTVRRVERNRRGLMRLHTEDGAVVDVGASYAKRVAAALGLPTVDPDEP